MSATDQEGHDESARRRVLDAACELLGEGALGAATMDVVAQRADMVTSAIYWHFPTKDALVLATLHRHTRTWVAEVQQAVASAPSPVGRLDRLLAHVRRIIVARGEDRRRIIGLVLDPDHDAHRAVLAKLFSGLRDALSQGLCEVTPIPPERSAVLADVVVSACDGLYLRHLADPDEARLDRALDELRRVVVLRVEYEVRRSTRASG